jgi:hypothetical protein
MAVDERRQAAAAPERAAGSSAQAAAAPPRPISPITVVSPVRRPWSWWLLLSWPFANRSRLVKGRLLELSFIHVAHWGLAKRGSRRPCVVFQSNFDGPAEHYAETFAVQVPWRIRGMWRGAYGFRDPSRPAAFARYVLEHAVNEPYHYYAAYPTATVRTVRAALRLRRSFAEFERRAAGLGPDELADAWREFLTREQPNL